MKKSLIFFIGGSCLVILLAPFSGAWGQDSGKVDLGQIVVSARQLPETLQETAHSVEVVTGQQIERRVVRSVSEALRELPGVVVQSLGTRGESVNVRIRGATNQDTLVLLDGVRLNNPATNETNLSLIPVEQIDRIEVLQGSQAVLYGGSAVGGVINIYTKAGGKDTEVKMSLEGGNLGYAREWLGFSGSKGPLRFNTGVSRTDEHGQFARDRFGETALTQRWDIEPTEKLALEITSHIFLSQKELARGFLIGPAPFYNPALPEDAFFLQLALDNNRVFDRLITTESLKVSYNWNDWVKTELLYGFFLSDEREKDSNVGEAGVTTPSGLVLAPNSVLNDIRASRQSADLRNFVFLPKLGEVEQTLTVGFEFYDERVNTFGEPFPGDSPPPAGSVGPFIPPLDKIPGPGVPGDRQNYAPYLQYHLQYAKRVFFDAGFRWDFNSAYGNELSPRVAVAVEIPEVHGKFHAAYGEGFLPPTIIQLFNPITGNPDLQPQKSQSYEAGYVQSIGEKADIYATFFYLDFDNLIDRLGENSNDAFSTGVEVGFAVRPIPQLTLEANYTYTHTVDESNGGIPFANVPAHVFNATLSANPWRKLTVDSTLSIVSDSREAFPVITTDGVFIAGTPEASLLGGKTSGHALWDLAVAYDFDLPNPSGHPRSVKVYTRAANILDDDYEESFGFPTPGFHLVTGAELRF